MAHRYSHSSTVRCGVDGMPAHFCWNESDWPVSEVFATWHLMDKWWVRPTNPATAIYSIPHGAQDRTYYRVCCRGPVGEQVFDLFHDAVTNLWVLDVAHD